MHTDTVLVDLLAELMDADTYTPTAKIVAAGALLAEDHGPQIDPVDVAALFERHLICRSTTPSACTAAHAVVADHIGEPLRSCRTSGVVEARFDMLADPDAGPYLLVTAVLGTEGGDLEAVAVVDWADRPTPVDSSGTPRHYPELSIDEARRLAGLRPVGDPELSMAVTRARSQH